jgi:4'-phosphopantetheinyl transferase EntD
MSWTELPPLSTTLGQQLPDIEGLSLVAALVAEYDDELLPTERPAVARAVPKRVREFATGRHLARLAMDVLDLPRAAIPSGPSRQPLWPAGCIGSITHSDDLAIAAVAAAGALNSVGIDLEVAERVTPNLHARLMTQGERRQLQRADPRMPGLLFSAKEAGYKTVHPLVGEFIGFQEAEVDVDWPGCRFKLRYVGDHEPNRVMDQGDGFFGFFERYVLTLFIIR